MRLLLLFTLLLFSFGISAELSLDQEITQMKEAPAEKRYEMMNKIKIRIASMNGVARAQAIAKIAGGNLNVGANSVNRQRKPVDLSTQNKLNIQNRPRPQVGSLGQNIQPPGTKQIHKP